MKWKSLQVFVEAKRVEIITGVRRSETQIREFLKKNSISVVEKQG